MVNDSKIDEYPKDSSLLYKQSKMKLGTGDTPMQQDAKGINLNQAYIVLAKAYLRMKASKIS